MMILLDKISNSILYDMVAVQYIIMYYLYTVDVFYQNTEGWNDDFDEWDNNDSQKIS